MNDDVTTAITTYLEADASSVVGTRFDGFIRALADVARNEGAAAAAAVARRAVSPHLDYTSIMRVARYLPKASEQRSEKAVRIAVLGGPTTIQLVKLLGVVLESFGIEARLYECEYGLFRQEILTPGSGLDAFQPNIVFLAVDARDVGPSPSVTSSPAERASRLEEEAGSWLALCETARTKWSATVILNTFVPPNYPVLGHFAQRHGGSRESFVERLNERLISLAPADVVFHDVRLLARELGHRHWFDPRFYLEAKMPCAPECLVRYAFSVGSLVRAIRGKSKKVLVLDLDNTLWGGVVGDVGVEGIALGQGSGEGEAFLAFQEYARALHDRGVVLAVCSKNDDARAREPFEKRADMALRLEHVACFVANWNDKASNLRHIAQTLSLGLDALVFVDDNPAERAIVRRLVPEVAVPDLPEDPASYVQALAAYQYFETVSFTAEDAERAAFYRQDAMRASASAKSEDIDSFLKSLDMLARVEPVVPTNVQRVTQLLNKSNQFNLTTRRYTQSHIEQLSTDASWSTITISLRDRFGDNGLISVLLARQEGKELFIDTWLMSCRVLLRGVEQFALGKLVETAKRRGCTTLTGLYLPTAKNEMVKSHYAKLGFTQRRADAEANGATSWTLDMSSFEPPATHIREA